MACKIGRLCIKRVVLHREVKICLEKTSQGARLNWDWLTIHILLSMKAYSIEADIHNIQSTTIVSEAEQWHFNWTSFSNVKQRTPLLNNRDLKKNSCWRKKNSGKNGPHYIWYYNWAQFMIQFKCIVCIWTLMVSVSHRLNIKDIINFHGVLNRT